MKSNLEVSPGVFRPKPKPADFERLAAVVRKMEWSGTRVEEDWQPDGRGGSAYEGISVCPVCGGRNPAFRTGPDVGHREGCEMGELCK